MFNTRSKKKELMDNFSLSNAELQQNLDELEIFNEWAGSKKLLIAALNKIYQKFPQQFKKSKKIVITDLGCGSGDLLRAMDRWAKSKGLDVDLVGIDANLFMIKNAEKKSHPNTNIQYKHLDILSAEFAQMEFDIVTINSFCHHLSDTNLIHLLMRIAKHTRIAIIINDLQRHWVSYLTVIFLTKIFNLSKLAKHDGPLSVLRAFRKSELLNILQQADIKLYQIRWVWPFRWELIIWGKP